MKKEGAVSGIAPTILLVAAQSRRIRSMRVSGAIVKANVSIALFKGYTLGHGIGTHNANKNNGLLI